MLIERPSFLRRLYVVFIYLGLPFISVAFLSSLCVVIQNNPPQSALAFSFFSTLVLVLSRHQVNSPAVMNVSEDVFDHSLVEFGNITQSKRDQKPTFTIDWKRIFDLTMALSMTLVFAPVLLMITLVIIAQGKPYFVRHRRLGQGGTSFGCLKFRTMVPSSDDILSDYLARHPDEMAEWNSTRRLTRDPRITPFGRFLRMTSLDELPQLFNVIRGEMSIVGPRPIEPAQAAFYGNLIVYYLRVKPGITGLWQVSQRKVFRIQDKVRIDTEYVRSVNLFLDLKILLSTVIVLLRK